MQISANWLEYTYLLVVHRNQVGASDQLTTTAHHMVRSSKSGRHPRLMYNIDWSVIVFGDTADNCSTIHWPTTHHSARVRSCVKTGRNKDNKHKPSKYNSIQWHVAKSRNTQDSIPDRHIHSRRSCRRNETTGRHIIKVNFPYQPKPYSKTWQQLSYNMCYRSYL